jgi:hypothetical protein
VDLHPRPAYTPEVFVSVVESFLFDKRVFSRPVHRTVEARLQQTIPDWPIQHRQDAQVAAEGEPGLEEGPRTAPAG